MGKAYLILENGAVFEGQTFGYDGEAIGELVFNTGMTGYLETLTDPSYYGQIVMQTFPLIGNYGVIPSDFESPGVHVKAYIVREWCQEPSNFRSEGELDTFLRNSGIPGLCGLDTRAVTKIVRENGVMNAKISKKPELTSGEWQECRAHLGERSVYTGEPEPKIQGRAVGFRREGQYRT
jgi:carbamoyl-phosphate synthase small subunit